MALPSGTRFGPYEVIAPIAAGGMGEVYRAVDRTLGRHVALKVLPDSFAQDADRLARFEREARTLASLNHPNIAQVYGLEERDGVRALVMELVEGPTLADRLAQGALRVEEALLIADQIGEALAAAHDQGVVHRDLTPANIMIGAGDRVKVLDFGLAKKVSAADGPDLTTVSRSLAATSPGTQMGTLPYMSPEQVRGEPLDARTDLWAFGCVLYELLAGAPAFRRATSAETIAAILGEPPDVAKLPPSMPAGVRLLIERCLRKDPKRRLHHAADARIELADATAELTGAVSAASSGGLAHRRGRARLWVPGVLAAVGLVAVGAIAVVWLGRGPSSGPAEGTVVTFSVPLPNDTAIRPGEVHTYVAVSPDGQHLVFATASARAPLYHHSFGDATTRPLAGTEGGATPIWSPDGRRIVFRSDVNGPPDLYVQDSDGGGAPQAILSLPAVLDPEDWSRDGRYIHYQVAARTTGNDLWLLPLDGGAPRPLLNTRYSEWGGKLSPDGRWVAFVSDESGASQVYLAPLADPGARRAVSTAGGISPRWRADGRELIYLGPNGAVMAVPVGSGPNLEIGEPRALFVLDTPISFGAYDVSPDGQSFVMNHVIEDVTRSPITVVLNWTALLKPSDGTPSRP